MTDTDARLWHPWLRINRVLRLMLHTHWSAEAWAEVRVEFRKALALRSQIRRAGKLTGRFAIDDQVSMHSGACRITGPDHRWPRNAAVEARHVDDCTREPTIGRSTEFPGLR